MGHSLPSDNFYPSEGFFFRLLWLMRRVWLHIAFWVLYVLQDTLLAYNWVGPSFKHVSNSRMLGIAVQAAMINMPYKLLLTYFVLYVSIPKITAANQALGRFVTEI